MMIMPDAGLERKIFDLFFIIHNIEIFVLFALRINELSRGFSINWFQFSKFKEIFGQIEGRKIEINLIKFFASFSRLSVSISTMTALNALKHFLIFWRILFFFHGSRTSWVNYLTTIKLTVNLFTPNFVSRNRFPLFAKFNFWAKKSLWIFFLQFHAGQTRQSCDNLCLSSSPIFKQSTPKNEAS
jgi:hypothetical protein